MFSRIHQSEENAAAGWVDGRENLIGRSRIGNRHPIGAEAGVKRIGLYLQPPAEVIHRPAQMHLTAAHHEVEWERSGGYWMRTHFSGIGAFAECVRGRDDIVISHPIRQAGIGVSKSGQVHGYRRVSSAAHGRPFQVVTYRKSTRLNSSHA